MSAKRPPRPKPGRFAKPPPPPYAPPDQSHLPSQDHGERQVERPEP